MLNNIFTKTTLSVALLIGGLDSAAASTPLNAGELTQSLAIAGYTAEQRALHTKGLQYRPGPMGNNASRVYHFNESKKNHRPSRNKIRNGLSEFSKPNLPHKLSQRGRVV